MPSVGVGVLVMFKTFEPKKKAEVRVKPNVVIRFDPEDREALEFVQSVITSSKVHFVIQSVEIPK